VSFIGFGALNKTDRGNVWTARVCGKKKLNLVQFIPQNRAVHTFPFVLLQSLTVTPVDAGIKSEAIEIKLCCYLQRTDTDA